MTSSLLIVLTSHNALGDTGRATGFHYEEFTTPYYAFKDAGYTVDIASVLGGLPPYDPSSLPDDKNEWPESVSRFMADAQAKKQLEQSFAMHEVNAERYAGLFIAGGHGTMWDLPNSKALSDVLVHLYEHGKLISSVCHGAAGLLNARLPKDNRAIIAGKQINSFSNEEEQAIELDEVVPFSLEDQLKDRGADYQHGKAFGSFVVRDGQFITGQNPASLDALCNKMLKALDARKRDAA